jgi:hypothetical protein
MKLKASILIIIVIVSFSNTATTRGDPEYISLRKIKKDDIGFIPCTEDRFQNINSKMKNIFNKATESPERIKSDKHILAKTNSIYSLNTKSKKHKSAKLETGGSERIKSDRRKSAIIETTESKRIKSDMRKSALVETITNGSDIVIYDQHDLATLSNLSICVINTKSGEKLTYNFGSISSFLLSNDLKWKLTLNDVKKEPLYNNINKNGIVNFLKVAALELIWLKYHVLWLYYHKVLNNGMVEEGFENHLDGYDFFYSTLIIYKADWAGNVFEKESAPENLNYLIDSGNLLKQLGLNFQPVKDNIDIRELFEMLSYISKDNIELIKHVLDNHEETTFLYILNNGKLALQLSRLDDSMFKWISDIIKYDQFENLKLLLTKCSSYNEFAIIQEFFNSVDLNNVVMEPIVEKDKKIIPEGVLKLLRLPILDYNKYNNKLNRALNNNKAIGRTLEDILFPNNMSLYRINIYGLMTRIRSPPMTEQDFKSLKELLHSQSDALKVFFLRMSNKSSLELKQLLNIYFMVTSKGENSQNMKTLFISLKKSKAAFHEIIKELQDYDVLNDILKIELSNFIPSVTINGALELYELSNHINLNCRKKWAILQSIHNNRVLTKLGQLETNLLTFNAFPTYKSLKAVNDSIDQLQPIFLNYYLVKHPSTLSKSSKGQRRLSKLIY